MIEYSVVEGAFNSPVIGSYRHDGPELEIGARIRLNNVDWEVIDIQANAPTADQPASTTLVVHPVSAWNTPN
jgi:hypothetical protein